MMRRSLLLAASLCALGSLASLGSAVAFEAQCATFEELNCQTPCTEIDPDHCRKLQFDRYVVCRPNIEHPTLKCTMQGTIQCVWETFDKEEGVPCNQSPNCSGNGTTSNGPTHNKGATTLCFGPG